MSICFKYFQDMNKHSKSITNVFLLQEEEYLNTSWSFSELLQPKHYQHYSRGGYSDRLNTAFSQFPDLSDSVSLFAYRQQHFTSYTGIGSQMMVLN